MHLTVRRAGAVRTLLMAGSVVLAVFRIESSMAATDRSAADFVRPREQLAFFEIYHMRDQGMMYRKAISLDALLTMQPVDDYVRVQKANADAVGELYAALRGTTFESSTDCSAPLFDARWAIVLNYLDKSKDVIAFGPTSTCIRFASKKEPIGASRALLLYVQRTFPFMH